MSKQFDLIVIGTGSAGSSVAKKCAGAGWKVAIIDSRPFGGTCSQRGCDPKKVLVGAAEVVDWQRRMKANGVSGKDVQIDWAELMRFKRTFTESVPDRTQRELTEVGITTFHGRAQFTDATTLQVNEETLTGRYVVIAAGAKPVDLGIPGIEFVTTSDQFLDLDALPKRIVFIGGGYISFEFAHIAVRAGSEVTILHKGKRPLEGFDADLVQQLSEASREVGIDLQTEIEVTKIEQKDKSFLIHTLKDSKPIPADLVVHGAGRVPDIDDMALEKAGIERSKRGIVVNEFLQSVSNSAVYAAGDAADSDGLPLTPVASAEASVVARNLLEGNKTKPNFTATPSVVFAIPPLASVGLTEEEAKEQALKFKVNYEETSTWYTSRRTNEKHTSFKILVEEGSGRILGAHLLGAHAEEVINLFALAIRHNLCDTDLTDMLYAYPTFTSDLGYML